MTHSDEKPSVGTNWRFAALRGRALWLTVTGSALLLVIVVAVVRWVTPDQPVGAFGDIGPTGAVGPRDSETPPGATEPEASAATESAGALPDPTEEVAGECPPATVEVQDAGSLSTALADAQPGASIRMADGLYSGRFKATTPASAAKPITLCGSAAAVIEADGVKGGYAFHLDGATYWRLVGFTVRNGQKGVMADRVQHVTIRGLTVEQVGDEAIHLRNFSSDNVVEGNTVRDTGQRREKFGEGIYVGTAQSNWCTITKCEPDRSDRNVVRGNQISGATAESIDIKEGTTGGSIIGNTFDGASLSGSHADSWVDVKGNGWLIKGNTGRNSREDGFQTHEVVDGWGSGNVFTANVAEVNGPGWGFHFAPVKDNRVACDNKATGAAKGLANVDCT